MAKYKMSRGWRRAAGGAAVGTAVAGGLLLSGSTPIMAGAAPVARAAVPTSGTGYWLANSEGAVYPLGGAVSYGSMAGKHLNAPIVGIVAAPDGKGYWLVAKDGGVFAFGSARFYDSLPGIPMSSKSVVGMAIVPVAGSAAAPAQSGRPGLLVLLGLPGHPARLGLVAAGELGRPGRPVPRGLLGRPGPRGPLGLPARLGQAVALPAPPVLRDLPVLRRAAAGAPGATGPTGATGPAGTAVMKSAFVAGPVTPTSPERTVVATVSGIEVGLGSELMATATGVVDFGLLSDTVTCHLYLGVNLASPAFGAANVNSATHTAQLALTGSWVIPATEKLPTTVSFECTSSDPLRARR